MTFDPDEQLEVFRKALAAEPAAERDQAASEIADWLEYGRGHPREFQSALVGLLIDVVTRETDEVALESVLNAIGSGTTYADLSDDLPWQRIGELLSRLRSPLLEYGLGILAECGDPTMVRFLRPYREHPVESVRKGALDAIAVLEPSAPAGSRQCACLGCRADALPDSPFCPFCEDQHFHTHGPSG